jgi:hypothetical protein
MRTTKTVEIEVCDVCGDEKSYSKRLCGKCGKDCCELCAEVFHVDVRRIKGHVGEAWRGSPMRPFRGTKIGHFKVKYTSYYCKDCAKPVLGALIAVGLVESIDSDNTGFVLD